MQDFGQLSDYDFEQLVADLLGAEWRVRVEYFPRGRDSGVDLRVLGPTPEPLNLPPQRELVVQCKHMPDAGITQLRRPLKEEASKKIASDAYRYVLVTSARLTRANKQEISLIFAGRLAEADIFGRNDVDDLLRRHPEVMRANMKLWLSSGTALQAFLNQVEHLRSNVLQTELEQLRPRLVQTSIVAKAQQMLDRLGVCILAGAPGVGKTTTAKILLMRYLSDGWQPIVAISDIRELETQLLPGIKQILFFDDFLGVTALPSKLTRGDDSALVRLIHLIEDDPSKAFILTTRDYILRQAQQAYEKLNDEAFSVARLVINIESLSESERAHILYNQLFFSPLRSAAAAAADGPRRYMALTRHSNYNPRLIEAAIAAASRELRIYSSRLPEPEHQADSRQHIMNGECARWIETSDGEIPDIPKLILRALDRPEQLWEHVLLHQLTQLQREILITRLSLGSAVIGITDFIKLVSDFAGASGNKPSRLELDMALKVLDGDLLSVTRSSASPNQLLINRLHPGVADSLIAMLHKYPDYLQMLIASASTFEQVRWIADFLSFNTPQRLREGQVIIESSADLAHCAERNISAPPIALDRSLWPEKAPHFSDFGLRLEVLSAIYANTGRHSTADFADQIVPQFLKAISKIRRSELVRVLTALQAHTFREWRSRRTEINVAVLGQLGDPVDTEDWSLLRDALDVTEITPQYLEELKEQFKELLDGPISDARDIIDEARESNDVDLPLDELEELAELAERWEVSSEIDYLIDELREIQDRRDEAEAERKLLERIQPALFEITESLVANRKHKQNQSTLFEATAAEPKRGDSIFDHF